MSAPDQSIPAGWKKKESKRHPGKIFYWNPTTGEKSWTRPTASSIAASSSAAESQTRKRKLPDASSIVPTGSHDPSTEHVHCLHLLRKHKDSRRPSSWREPEITCTLEDATTTLQGLHDTISSEEDVEAAFRKAAAEHSDCSSAARGGDLGEFGRGRMQKAFEEASFGLSVGELSPIITTASGVHIILRLK